MRLLSRCAVRGSCVRVPAQLALSEFLKGFSVDRPSLKGLSVVRVGPVFKPLCLYMSKHEKAGRAG